MSDTPASVPSAEQQIAALQLELAKALLSIADDKSHQLSIDLHDQISECVQSAQTTFDMISTLTQQKGAMMNQVLRARKAVEAILEVTTPDESTNPALQSSLTDLHDVLCEVV